MFWAYAAADQERFPNSGARQRLGARGIQGPHPGNRRATSRPFPATSEHLLAASRPTSWQLRRGRARLAARARKQAARDLDALLAEARGWPASSGYEGDSGDDTESEVDVDGSHEGEGLLGGGTANQPSFKALA